MYQFLKLEKEPPLAYITINRPEVMNALSNALTEELGQAFDEVEKDEEIRVLIITGAGEKAFMAGADIKEVQERDFVLGRKQTRRRQEVLNKLAEMPIPVIAAVNGFALGAGLEMAIACTLRIASTNAKMGSPEVNLGIIPGDGATQRLPRLVGFGRAMELVLTGGMIDAEEAYRIGLVNKVVPLENLMDEVKKLANLLASKPPLALQYAKEAVNRSMEVGLYEGMAHESYLHALACASEDKKEGVAAFLEKRKAQFKGK
ncbi:MAG TPA: crotonase [Firmicutes bacterium]|jgi:enoyl-CoA hydratase|nr:crotonase [Bacillota bacterium]HAA33809.1 crotonase [Bacillota bacterium]